MVMVWRGYRNMRGARIMESKQFNKVKYLSSGQIPSPGQDANLYAVLAERNHYYPHNVHQKVDYRVGHNSLSVKIELAALVRIWRDGRSYDVLVYYPPVIFRDKDCLELQNKHIIKFMGECQLVKENYLVIKDPIEREKQIALWKNLSNDIVR
jgi:hypothetical protein